MTAQGPCARRAADWRRQAQIVREHQIGRGYLTGHQRAELLREAETCEALAAWWQNAADTEEIAA